MNSIDFTGLSGPSAEKLRELAHYRRFSRNEAVFREGDRYTGPYLVAEGQFKIFMLGDEGKESIMHIFRVGELIAGGPMLLGGAGYPAYCSALSDGCLIAFEYDRLKKLIVTDEVINTFFVSKSVMLIPRLKEKIENLTLKNAEGRIYAYLKSLGADKGPIELDVPKNQIAALLDLTPESVSRVCNQLVAKGLLETNGKTYRLREQ
ncbi:Crp/Fnr family transcriptional regulator [Turneriella parva]|nr:Crp/Fnr family transcriptional regulator [Turneriella parva]